MLFFYRHWHYIVAVVLCVVLLGVLKLYFDSEPSEVKTVYTIAEPNPEQSRRFTAGSPTTSPVSAGVYHSTKSVPQQTPAVHGDDDADSPQAETTLAALVPPDDAYQGMTTVQRRRALQRRLIEHADKEIALFASNYARRGTTQII